MHMPVTWRLRLHGSMLCDTAMSGVERSAAGVARARVLAVDDDRRFLALLHDLVRATGHLEIVGEESSGERAVAAARELRPDVVLMDVRMPGIGGLTAAERIKATAPSTLVVLITTTHPDEIPRDACDRFAAAVLWKSTLDPVTLDELWLRHRAGRTGRPGRGT